MMRPPVPPRPWPPVLLTLMMLPAGRAGMQAGSGRGLFVCDGNSNPRALQLGGMPTKLERAGVAAVADADAASKQAHLGGWPWALDIQ